MVKRIRLLARAIYRGFRARKEYMKLSRKRLDVVRD